MQVVPKDATDLLFSSPAAKQSNIQYHVDLPGTIMEP